METQQETADIKGRITALRQRYTRLALQCKAAGLRVNPETVEAYLQELRKLQE